MPGRHPLRTTTEKGGSPLLSIRLGQGDTKRLDRFAVDRGVSRSEVVREALDRYLAEFDSYLEESPKAS